jgi:3-hydroxybutyryl-CoA dehydrogenase
MPRKWVQNWTSSISSYSTTLIRFHERLSQPPGKPARVRRFPGLWSWSLRALSWRNSLARWGKWLGQFQVRLMRDIQSVMIVGAGWVGRQIAARMAKSGLQVWLLDRNSQVIEQAFQWLQQIYDQTTASSSSPPPASAEDDRPARQPTSVSGPEFNWLANLHVAPSLQELQHATGHVPAPEIQLALECVPEQLSLKKRVLRQVSEIFPAPVIVASNSSYFVPSLLQGYIAQPERYAHMHFHVPVLNDSVVDIVGGADTDTSTVQRLVNLSRQVGLEPLQLRREHPGYVFNWMLQALLKAALELAVLDVVDPEDIDKSWQSVTGMPVGPFGMMDRIGLDVIEQVLANARWAEALQVDTASLLELIQEHTRRGELGTKTGRGFYEYDEQAMLLRDRVHKP